MTDTLQKAIEACVTSQAMIDINAMHLDGLRTQCELGAELTQTEIRNLETKLIKLFNYIFYQISFNQLVALISFLHLHRS